MSTENGKYVDKHNILLLKYLPYLFLISFNEHYLLKTKLWDAFKKFIYDNNDTRKTAEY